MAGLPGNVNFGIVEGKFTTAEQLDVAEPDGVPVAGAVTFTPTPKALVNVAASTVIVPKPITVSLDVNGAFSTSLVATDDPDLEPADWTYLVTFEFGALIVEPYHIEVPMGMTIDLSVVMPVPVGAGTFYATRPLVPGTVLYSDTVDRPTDRPDVMVIFTGPDPGSNALDGDRWMT